MARILKEKDYAEKRSEILAAAQRFIYTKGYEQMSIQDILNALQISKGAFYHYFSSKQDLLEALIEQLIQEGLALIRPIMDAQLPAIEKFRTYFGTAVRWKTDQKEYLLALLKTWYADDNAIVRQKMLAASLKKISPMIAQIIDQGVREGVFHPAYPDLASEVALSLMMSMGDAFANHLLSCPPGERDMQRLEHMANAYTDALERVLGAPEGALPLIDRQTVAEWSMILLPADAPAQPATG